MADMHTLNTRIKLKYDTYANWIANDPVLLAGEVAIATVADNENNKTSTGFQNLPNVVIKVGDGSSKYSALKFVSALAADVHEWAKGAEKPKYKASEIEDLESFIAGEIQDTDTQYEIRTIDASTYKLGLYSWAKGVDHSTAGTLVSEIDLSAIDTRLDTIEAALGEGGSVASKIQAAIDALDMAKVEAGTTERIVSVEQVNGVVAVTKGTMGIANVDGLQAALDAKQGNLAFEGIYNEGTNKVVTKSAMDTAIQTAVDGLDKADAAVDKQFVTAVSEENGIITVTRAALKAADIPTIEQAQVNGLVDALKAKQDNLVIANDYNAESNPVATVATVTAAVADLNGAMHFEGKVEKDPTTFTQEENAAYSAGDVVLFGIYEYVYDGSAWLPLGAEGIYELKTDAADAYAAIRKELADGLAEKQGNLAFEGEYNEASNKVVTKDAMTAAITAATEALDKADAAVANQFVTAVSEENGIITVTRAQPEIANVNGLTERLSGIDGEIAKKQDALQFEGVPSADNKVVTKSAMTTAITDAVNGLDAADTAVEGEFVTAVPQENGVIAVSRAKVTTDHIQQGAKVLVFDCGSSADSDISA